MKSHYLTGRQAAVFLFTFAFALPAQEPPSGHSGPEVAITGRRVEIPSGSTTHSFVVTDDAFVWSRKENVNYGNESELRVRKTSQDQFTYLKFNVSGLTGQVVETKLRLFAIDGSDDAGAIYKTSNEYNSGGAWEESGITWLNAPALGDSALASRKAVSAGQLIEFDLTGAISENGQYSFAIANRSRDVMKYSSKEGGTPPELVIVTEGEANGQPILEITGFVPASGAVGTQVTIVGANFTKAIEVRFGSTVSVFSVESETEIRSEVPAEAESGVLGVTTPEGSVTSDNVFIVETSPIPAPLISEFTPSSGPVGTDVTIRGRYFTGVSLVSFHDVPAATFVIASDSILIAQVPSGATSGKIALAGGESSGMSSVDFQVTSTEPPAPDWLRKLADDVLARAPDPDHLSFDDWRTTTRMQGIMRAYEATGDERYFDYIKSWIDSYVDGKGNVPLRESNPHVFPGLFMLMIYEITEEPRYLVAAQKMADHYLRNVIRNPDGAIIHAPRLEDQIWCDTLNGILLFFAKMGSITGESIYFEEAINQILLHSVHLQDEETGLFYHAWDLDGSAEWADPISHRSQEFWSRGLSWVVLSMADFLEYVPVDYPRRDEVVAIFERLMLGLLAVQDQESGLWFTILDKKEAPGNYQETSGSADIVYGLARALKQGYLDPSLERNLDIARLGLLKEINEQNGQVYVNNVSEGTGVGDYDYYVARKRGTGIDYIYGDGCFLMALAALSEFEKRPQMMMIESGNTQTGFTDRYLSQSVKVRVVDVNGEPIRGVRVKFVITEGGGVLQRFHEVITAGDGTAWNRWRLGPEVGEQTLQVRAENLGTTLDFSATALLSQINTATFFPTDDSFVWSRKPTESYGGEVELRVRQTREDQIAYFKFNVSGLIGPVRSAKLRLFITDDSDDLCEVYFVSNEYASGGDWKENVLSWTNAPEVAGSALSSSPSLAQEVAEFDVTAAVAADGLHSFALRSSSNDVLKFSSKEGAFAPELVIETGPESSAAKHVVSNTDTGRVATEKDNSTRPNNLFLKPNYPNPFNAETQIVYGLGEPGEVRLLIFNMRGQKVRELIKGFQTAGLKSVLWNGQDDSGRPVSSGLYLVQLRVDSRVFVRKLVMQK